MQVQTKFDWCPAKAPGACLSRKEKGDFDVRSLNHTASKIFAPIFERPFDSSKRSPISIKPNRSRKVIPELISGEPHCPEICVFRCESKSFLQRCHTNKHSKRCAKSHVLDRRASCPAVPTLTSIWTIT